MCAANGNREYVLNIDLHCLTDKGLVMLCNSMRSHFGGILAIFENYDREELLELATIMAQKNNVVIRAVHREETKGEN